MCFFKNTTTVDIMIHPLGGPAGVRWGLVAPRGPSATLPIDPVPSWHCYLHQKVSESTQWSWRTIIFVLLAPQVPDGRLPAHPGGGSLYLQ